MKTFMRYHDYLDWLRQKGADEKANAIRTLLPLFQNQRKGCDTRHALFTEKVQPSPAALILFAIHRWNYAINLMTLAEKRGVRHSFRNHRRVEKWLCPCGGGFSQTQTGGPIKSNGLYGERRSTDTGGAFRKESGAVYPSLRRRGKQSAGCPPAAKTGQKPRAASRGEKHCISHKGKRPRSCERGAGIRAGVNIPARLSSSGNAVRNSLTDTRDFQRCCWFCRWGSILTRKRAAGV